MIKYRNRHFRGRTCLTSGWGGSTATRINKSTFSILFKVDYWPIHKSGLGTRGYRFFSVVRFPLLAKDVYSRTYIGYNEI